MKITQFEPPMINLYQVTHGFNYDYTVKTEERKIIKTIKLTSDHKYHTVKTAD